MAKKKKVSERYKPFKTVRVPMPLALAMEKVAVRKFSNLTEQVKQAVVEFLERNGVKPDAN